MIAVGEVFLSKQKPLATTAKDGTFQLLLCAFDVQSPKVSGARPIKTPWRVLWSGSDAQAWHYQNQAALVPGAALYIEAEAIRTHELPGCAAEITAQALCIGLGPFAAAKATETKTEQQA